MKNHISLISIGIFALGLAIIVYSTIRWGFLYPDTSQMVLGCLAGFQALFFAYIYNWMRNTDSRISRLQRQADTIGAKVTGNLSLAEEEEMQGIK